MSTTMTSREFNQDTGRAKKAAKDGPVFITDRGKPAHVLMSIGDYRKLAGEGASLADAIAQKDGAGIDFDPPRIGTVARAADLS